MGGEFTRIREAHFNSFVKNPSDLLIKHLDLPKGNYKIRVDRTEKDWFVRVEGVVDDGKGCGRKIGMIFHPSAESVSVGAIEYNPPGIPLAPRLVTKRLLDKMQTCQPLKSGFGQENLDFIQESGSAAQVLGVLLFLHLTGQHRDWDIYQAIQEHPEQMGFLQSLDEDEFNAITRLLSKFQMEQSNRVVPGNVIEYKFAGSDQVLTGMVIAWQKNDLGNTVLRLRSYETGQEVSLSVNAQVMIRKKAEFPADENPVSALVWDI